MSDRPAYRQVADELRRRIVTGDVAPGGLLPSESELIEEFGISRTTARLAFGVLRSEGLIDTIAGKGAFVRPRPALRRLGSDRYVRWRREPGQTPFTADAEERAPHIEAVYDAGVAGPELAARLGVDEGTGILHRRFRFYADGEPVQVSVSSVPYDLVKGTPVEDPANEPWPGGTIGQMESLGVRVTEVIEDVTVRAPLPDEVEALQLRPGVAVFAVTRTMLAGQRAVETADIVMAGDRYRLSYRIPLL